MFVNKSFIETPPHKFLYRLSVATFATMAGLNSYSRDLLAYWLQSLKCLLSDPSHKKFADSWLYVPSYLLPGCWVGKGLGQ